MVFFFYMKKFDYLYFMRHWVIERMQGKIKHSYSPDFLSLTQLITYRTCLMWYVITCVRIGSTYNIVNKLPKVDLLVSLLECRRGADKISKRLGGLFQIWSPKQVCLLICFLSSLLDMSWVYQRFRALIIVFIFLMGSSHSGESRKTSNMDRYLSFYFKFQLVNTNLTKN